ncbi:3-phosphoshikimate 1-carboxyvinyltransferase [Temperatibacter marinus]|uniref:3-phosphoshikimate 1-carboxyvinyltransferase n=1 Tax=Temperatibacter marinus TaxID=1456591 RepID=A0AA52EJU5_9PROT|nr:3-phosphoshikimate 1-carboxyvinyltransferase [Temperatibacter marinus]WND03837.1 3-phosphoshikimate 1-carboxyvinyltransferase [Temperatibacter marinus]
MTQEPKIQNIDPSMKSSAGDSLKGTVQVPGDKSISHRSLMLSSLAVGESRVRGLLEGEDVLATAEAMRQMGADINRSENGEWRIHGVGVGGLKEPADVIDMGNSGTSTRLILGLLSSHELTATMTGDGSLRGRPMKRVITPMEQMGARFMTRRDGRLPLAVTGTSTAQPLSYESPVASAQVKSCVLLAGLNTRGVTTLKESVATRDHTERMLSAMGADLMVSDHEDGSRTVSITGPVTLSPIDLDVPGDISSAAFLLVAASIIPESDVTLKNVGMNPLRTGIIFALKHMGADITLLNEQILGGEPVADIRVKAARLKGVTDLPVHPSTMIDEFPVLFCAASVASGTSRFTGLEELRVKESDRIAVMAQGLKACGVSFTELEDGIEIVGNNGKVKGGGHIDSHLDHRIAMSFSILGQMAQEAITIDDASPINTSFPGFKNLMQGLGASLD